MSILGPDGKPIKKPTDPKADEVTEVELHFEKSLDQLTELVQVFANQSEEELLPTDWAERFILALATLRSATQALVIDRNDKMIMMAQKLNEAATLILQLREINARLVARNN